MFYFENEHNLYAADYSPTNYNETMSLLFPPRYFQHVEAYFRQAIFNAIALFIQTIAIGKQYESLAETHRAH